MPIPKPHQNEKKKDFISRCMSDMSNKDKGMSNDQKYAICQQQWKDKAKASNIDAMKERLINGIKKEQ